MSSGRSELHELLVGDGGHDLPVTLSLLRLHQLPVMPEDCCRRIAHFERELCRIVKLRQVIGTEAVPQSILWPFCEQPGAFPILINFSLQIHGTHLASACAIRRKPFA